MTTLLVAALTLGGAPRPVAAHSFLSVPLPLSKLAGCRIGGSGNDAVFGKCGGPCPNSEFRADANTANPAAVYRRGGRYEMRWTRNNHEGGFVRLSLVPVSQMYNHGAHERNAFHWSCWAINRFKCGQMDKYRDCKHDRKGEAFRDWVTIPPVFPDGDYVLGWSWYGGGEGDKGHFGDYYDCSFVRVEGGRSQTATHTPTFAGGSCLATVNRLGICTREPCSPMRKVLRRVPVEFDGRSPPLIRASNLPRSGGPPKYKLTSSGQSTFSENIDGLRRAAVRVFAIRLVDVNARKVLPYLPLGNRPVVVGASARFSLYAETSPDALSVQWYVNGVPKFFDSTPPFTSGGDDHTGAFYPWYYPVFNRRVYVSVRAKGPGNTEDWFSLEMQFVKDRRRPGNYVGV